MDIYIASNDIELKRYFEKIDSFNEVVMLHEMTESAKEFDIVLISDKIMNINEVSMKKVLFKSQKVYYMVSNASNKQMLNNIYSVCKTNNITVIPPKLTVSQIAEKILGDLFPNSFENGNVITLIGADSKVGTTMIAQSVSEDIAKNTNAKVLLINLNNKDRRSYLKSKSPEFGIDTLKVKLFNKILTKEELLECCIREDNLLILPGIESILDIREYHPEDIEILINLGLQVANLIIIDAGSVDSMDLSGCLGITALNVAKYKYLVTTQQKSSYDTFMKVKDEILTHLQINQEDFFAIVNKYFKSSGLLSADEVAKNLNMILAGYVNHLEFAGWESEIEEKTLMSESSYRTSIEQVSQLISNQLDLRYSQKEDKKGILQKMNFLLKK